jgi:hypothetical protein
MRKDILNACFLNINNLPQCNKWLEDQRRPCYRQLRNA